MHNSSTKTFIGKPLRVLACIASLLSCRATHTPSTADASNRPIGVATLRKDGVLELHLRAESTGKDGTLGDALFVYQKTDADYSKILEHLGDMQPGQTKDVPPWENPPSR